MYPSHAEQVGGFTFTLIMYLGEGRDGIHVSDAIAYH